VDAPPADPNRGTPPLSDELRAGCCRGPGAHVHNAKELERQFEPEGIVALTIQIVANQRWNRPSAVGFRSPVGEYVSPARRRRARAS